MGKKLLNLDSIKLAPDVSDTSESFTIKEISTKDIAIIGIACHFPLAPNKEDFWQILLNGFDCIGKFPRDRRKDTDAYLKFTGIRDEELQYNEGAYLEEIDKFDYNYFRLSPKEAGVMDPNQRLFLQIAVKTLEDAGYGGDKLKGSRTGIYVGYSSDFDYEFKRFIQEIDPSLMSLAVAGNVKSIIASRLAYLLDFHGPSMLVDTACSSALTAIHLACQALRKGECDQALVGAAKIRLLPLKTGEGIGIRSSDGRARTFDDSSDGTGSGEGVAAVLLKPLKRALADRDNIYAVIKGSALNQDGSSIGITAPNAIAQADVLERAWNDAGIDPETISFIEAHGTGTRLGDPIEIDGLTRAFNKYTDKKQFCAISAVKTNIGHLDNAAGMAGLIKAVLSLKYRKLIPVIHFENPNKQIDFSGSPLYVVDNVMEWEKSGQIPRRCGISAFGLSGTNCHLVLEEAPEDSRPVINKRPYVLTISARSQTALMQLVDAYEKFIEKEEVNLDSLCFTANTGRGHYSHRLVILFKTREELKDKLNYLGKNDRNNLSARDIYSGRHRIISVEKQISQEGELTEEEYRQLNKWAEAKMKEIMTDDELSRDELIRELCQYYVKGAQINWEKFYEGCSIPKDSLPTYPFDKNRCWLEIPEKRVTKELLNESDHPLIDYCLVKSLEQDIYVTRFSVERHWVVNEHIVNENYVVPGTTYVEMGRAIAKNYYPHGFIELRDIHFLSPLKVDVGEIKEVQTIVRKGKDVHEFIIASQLKDEERWIIHAEGKFAPIEDGEESLQVDLEELKKKCPTETIPLHTDDSGKIIRVGPRFKNTKKVNYGEKEMFVTLELAPEFSKDLEEFGLHPSMLDNALNVLISSFEGVYLPFSYKKISIYGSTPAKFYSYLVKKEKEKTNQEVMSCDVLLFDDKGRCFAQIEEYSIKRVSAENLNLDKYYSNKEMYFSLSWQRVERNDNLLPTDGKILIFTDKKGFGLKIADRLRNQGVDVIQVQRGQEFEKISENNYILSNKSEDLDQLLNEVQTLTAIIHLETLMDSDEILSITDLKESEEKGIYNLFYLTKSLIKNRFKNDLDIFLIADYCYQVTGDEKRLNPHNAAFFGLGRVVGQEHANFHIKCIDIDDEVSIDDLLTEIREKDESLVALRQGQRFIPGFDKIDIEAVLEKPIDFKETGVYIITGGTGGLGLTLAQYLTSSADTQNISIRLALLSRTQLPLEDDWKQILSENGDEKLAQKLKTLKEIKDSGVDINCYSVDVAKPDELQDLISMLRKKYGRINGIIHCAGVAGDGFIFRKDEKNFTEVLAPKVEGTWLLDHLTTEDSPDFFILFSSVTSLLGGPGQGDYTAANSYLDSFAHHRARKGLRTLVINWPAWKEIGMAVDYGANVDGVIFKALPTKKALHAFAEVWGRNLNQVIIGEINYETIGSAMDKLPFKLTSRLKNLIKKKIRVNHDRKEDWKEVSKVTVIGKETTDLDLRIARAWGRVLGLQEIDAYESFYNLGGDSILATQLLKELDKEFPGLIDIADIFTYSTIDELSKYIASKLNQESNLEKVDDLTDTDLDDFLDKLASGEIDVDEIDSFLKKEDS